LFKGRLYSGVELKMSIIDEAAHLYVFSKELSSINKDIKRLSRKIEKHAHNHKNASNDKKREKYRKKHLKTKNKIAQLVKRHRQIFNRIKHHMVGYNEALRKEHKV